MSGDRTGKGSIGIIGGGAMGIAAAFAARDAHPGARVVLYEAGARLGGLADAWGLELAGGETLHWDRHYHVTLESDADTRWLLSRAEPRLDAELRWRTTATGFHAGGRLAPMSSALDFLRLPNLSLRAKLGMGLGMRRGCAVQDPEPLERVPVADWLRRISGEAAYAEVWKPLLHAKLGRDHADVSATFIWATMQRLTAARRTGLKTERFGFVPGGYGRVMAALHAGLEAAGVEVRLSAPVGRVAPGEDAATVYGADRSAEAFDTVLLTTTPSVADRLVPVADAATRAALRGVAYQGLVCTSVVLDRPLLPYYLTYLTDQTNVAPFTAVVDMSAFVGAGGFGGRGLVYLPLYTAANDPVFNEPDASLHGRFLAALGGIVPQLREREVLAVRTSRVREVFPRPSIHQPPGAGAPVVLAPRVALCGSAQIRHGTLNVNDGVALARSIWRSGDLAMWRSQQKELVQA